MALQFGDYGGASGTQKAVQQAALAQPQPQTPQQAGAARPNAVAGFPGGPGAPATGYLQAPQVAPQQPPAPQQGAQGRLVGGNAPQIAPSGGGGGMITNMQYKPPGGYPPTEFGLRKRSVMPNGLQLGAGAAGPPPAPPAPNPQAPTPSPQTVASRPMPAPAPPPPPAPGGMTSNMGMRAGPQPGQQQQGMQAGATKPYAPPPAQPYNPQQPNLPQGGQIQAPAQVDFQKTLQGLEGPQFGQQPGAFGVAEQALQKMSANPNPYAQDAFQAQLAAGRGELEATRDQQLKAMDETMASRGMFYSTAAGEKMEGIRGQFGRGLSGLNAQLLGEQARMQGDAQNSLMQNALGLGNAQSGRELSQAGMSQDAQQFRAQLGLSASGQEAEQGRFGAQFGQSEQARQFQQALSGEQFGQEERQFGASHGLQARGQDIQSGQFGQQLGLQERQQSAQEGQFNQQFGEGQRQFNSEDALRQAQFGESQKQFGQQFGLQERQQGAQEKQFGQQFGLQERQQGAQESQFGQQFGENQRQFGQQFGEGQRQFDTEAALRQAQFGESQKQFGQEFGLQERKQGAQESQFGEQMGFDKSLQQWQAEQQQAELALRSAQFGEQGGLNQGDMMSQLGGQPIPGVPDTDEMFGGLGGLAGMLGDAGMGQYGTAPINPEQSYGTPPINAVQAFNNQYQSGSDPYQYGGQTADDINAQNQMDINEVKLRAMGIM